MLHDKRIIATTADMGSGHFEINLGALVGFLARSRWIIVRWILIALVLGGLFLGLTPAKYTAEALVLIEEVDVSQLGQQARQRDALTLSAFVESQVDLLRSDQTARSVITSKDFPPGVFRSAVPPLLELCRTYFKFCEDRVASWTSDPIDEVQDPDRRIAEMVKRFRGATQISRSQSTYVVEVSFTAHDPATAAKIANSIVSTYLLDQRRSKEDILRSTNRWLKDRSVELQRDAQKAEEAFETMRGAPLRDEGERAQLKELEATARSYRAISDNFLQKYIQSSQEQSFLLPPGRLVSEAWPPAERSFPKRGLVGLLCLVAGFAVGVMRAAIKEAGRQRPPEPGYDIETPKGASSQA